jgi:N-methylhydantoinase B/oxoprolinase/acetone carboxylase alpha subunit
MQSFRQFVESGTGSSDIEAVEDFIDGLKKLVKKYNRTTLEKVWSKITSSKGEELVKEIIRNPSKSSSDLRKLVAGK